LVEELEARNYSQQRGHLFVKEAGASSGSAIVDILVPAYRSRQSKQRTVGGLVTIEVAMLAEAIATAESVPVHLIDRSGATFDLDVPLPHPLAALALKFSAWDARQADKDAFDVWRCLEACRYDGELAWPSHRRCAPSHGESVVRTS
jgi:hypothetical protein